MQGWAPDFIPLVTRQAIEEKNIDEIRPVAGDDAIAWAKLLAREEGIFCGITAGATFAEACKLAAEMPEGTRVLAMIPDTGERYMSTPLFEGIEEDMNEEEMEISSSTPGARFDAPPPPAPATPGPSANDPGATETALDHIDAITMNEETPLAFFSLEWCEFCWSAQKLLDAMGVEYRNVHLDGVDYADGKWASEVRAALAQRSGGAPTIPQIFLRGKHLGGATDLFDAYNNGELDRMLAEAKIAFTRPEIENAYALLPKWMQKR